MLMAKKKVLIAGASDLVGSAAVRCFAQLPAWEVVGVSRRTSEGVAGPPCAKAYGAHIGRIALPARERAPRPRHENFYVPADMQAFVVASVGLADFCFAHGVEHALPPILVSTIKLRQAGFHACMDTDNMLRKWFRRFQDLRFLPTV
jgi:NAD(P)-dependent dehydrogenase (short-subunit alcohol dehydrogenase family)